MEFWHFLILLVVSNLLTLIGVYSGFYFGWMAKRNVPPPRMPIISKVEDFVESVSKKEEEEQPKGFFS